MFITGIFKAVSNMMKSYENQMNSFYKEVGKLDARTQMNILGMMHYRR